MAQEVFRNNKLTHDAYVLTRLLLVTFVLALFVTHSPLGNDQGSPVKAATV